MLPWEPHKDGTLLLIKAQPGARRRGLSLQNGLLKVAVTEPPEKGKANRAILELLAGVLGCAPSQLELVSGETAARKRVLARTLTPDRVRKQLSAVLPELADLN